MYILKKGNLKSLLTEWEKESQLFTPQLEDGQVMLLPYEENSFTLDYINFAFPVKEHLFKQKEILFNWESDSGEVKVETPRNLSNGNRIYFGIRPCDAYGIMYMDKFFLEGYRDEFYGKEREKALIVAMNCIEPGENCFCTSMGTGPFANGGYDLLFTQVKDGYLVEVGTDKGEKLISSAKKLFEVANNKYIEEKDILEENTDRKFRSKIKVENISKVLEDNFDNPMWETLARDCIGCTGCTSLCPTCTCFIVVEESTGKNSGCRVRYWDSCQSDSFTRNAKNHNPRNSVSRVRYRIYDKLKYIEEKFGMKGCTGCGRCINVCPASINIVEIINKLADKQDDGGGFNG